MAAPKLGKSHKEKMQRGQTVFGTFFQYTVNPRTIQQGPRFVVYSNDGALLRESLEQSFTQLRKR